MNWEQRICRHVTRCFLGGLVAILPVGGAIVMLFYMESTLKPLVTPLPFYFPGLAMVAVAVAVYVLGLTVTSVVGSWIWRRVDRLLERLPALGTLYQTLKQVLGYGGGKDALFRAVVLVTDEATGAAEIGLLTGEIVLAGAYGRRCAVFLPGAPNPSAGRLVWVAPERCRTLPVPVDAALKTILSLGKAPLIDEGTATASTVSEPPA